MKFLVIVLGGVALVALALHVWLRSDLRAADAERARLEALAPRAGLYHPDMVADFPEPVRRYFGFAIAPGTPLYRRVTLTMQGQLGLGTQAEPGYFPFDATQVIAAPEGFIWALNGRMKGLPVGGSDTGAWTRFWLAGVVPVARAGGTDDHRLSAFGRYMAEAALWLPTALLPSDTVRWSSPGPDQAQADITYDGLHLRLVLYLDGDGRPTQTRFQRWSNANPEKTFAWQGFGGEAIAWQQVQGVQIATQVEAGHHFGTPDYFPFFKATITDAHLE